jgi:hypothetical protein
MELTAARRSDTIARSTNGMLMRVIRAACAVSINAVMTNCRAGPDDQAEDVHGRTLAIDRGGRDQLSAWGDR